MSDPRKADPLRRRLLRTIGATMLLTFATGSVAGPQTAAQNRKFTVVMANMSFGRMPTGVKVGDTIEWVNRDTVPHTATARDKSFDVRVQQGQTVSMVVKKAGNIPVYCIYHPAMRATLNVSA